jgi:HSP20 family protein
MATVPVPVKQSAPAPATTPDIWRSLRTEMDRLFDNFTGRFGVTPFFPRFDMSLSLPSPAVDITEEEGAFKVTPKCPVCPRRISMSRFPVTR